MPTECSIVHTYRVKKKLIKYFWSWSIHNNWRFIIDMKNLIKFMKICQIVPQVKRIPNNRIFCFCDKKFLSYIWKLVLYILTSSWHIRGNEDFFLGSSEPIDDVCSLRHIQFTGQQSYRVAFPGHRLTQPVGSSPSLHRYQQNIFFGVNNKMDKSRISI